MKIETRVCIIQMLSNTRIQTHLNDSSPTKFSLSTLSCSLQTSLSLTANQVHREARRSLRSAHFKLRGRHADERNNIHCTRSNLSCRTISQTHLSTNKDKRERGESIERLRESVGLNKTGHNKFLCKLFIKLFLNSLLHSIVHFILLDAHDTSLRN